jgi:hypothetical protein
MADGDRRFEGIAEDVLDMGDGDTVEVDFDPIREEGEEPPTDDDFVDPADVQSIVSGLIEEAVQHYDQDREPDQVKATEYYFGEPFGNEMEGRSQVVNTVVRDATLDQMPSLMRIFAGKERYVEYEPRVQEGMSDEMVSQRVQQAAQATDYANYVMMEKNPGYRILWDTFEDALVRRLGVITWWWEDIERVEAAELSGLSQEEVQVLEEDPEITVELLGEPYSVPVAGLEEAPLAYDVRATYRNIYGEPKVASVLPENFFFTPAATGRDEAAIIGHSRELAIEEIEALVPGVSEDELEAAKTRGNRNSRSSSASADLENTRNRLGGDESFDGADQDPSREPILFTEAYGLIDVDGDGISELRLFQCIGSNYEIINGIRDLDGEVIEPGEIVDEIPFALFTPTPEAHAIEGLGNFDLLGDIQLITSQIERGQLDSLAQAINSDTEVVDGQVNMKDVLSPDISRIIRVSRPGMMREVKHTFVGDSTLPILGYYDTKTEDRTGKSRASKGLDADALQSSTKEAVSNTFTKSQERVELIARTFAETGMKQLFRGILRLITKHQNWQEMVRLRGEFVRVDPRAWDAMMDVSVNVAIGQGTPADRLAGLESIISKQTALLEAGSPVVTMVELRHSLALQAEMLGYKDPSAFYRPWTEEQDMAAKQAAAQQPPPPDPAMELVRIEEGKLQLEQMKARVQLQLDATKAQREDDFNRDKLARDTALKEQEIESKYKTEIDKATINAEIARDRARMDAPTPGSEAR